MSTLSLSSELVCIELSRRRSSVMLYLWSCSCYCKQMTVAQSTRNQIPLVYYINLSWTKVMAVYRCSVMKNIYTYLQHYLTPRFVFEILARAFTVWNLTNPVIHCSQVSSTSRFHSAISSSACDSLLNGKTGPKYELRLGWSSYALCWLAPSFNAVPRKTKCWVFLCYAQRNP